MADDFKPFDVDGLQTLDVDGLQTLDLDTLNDLDGMTPQEVQAILDHLDALEGIKGALDARGIPD